MTGLPETERKVETARYLVDIAARLSPEQIASLGDERAKRSLDALARARTLIASFLIKADLAEKLDPLFSKALKEGVSLPYGEQKTTVRFHADDIPGLGSLLWAKDRTNRLAGELFEVESGDFLRPERLTFGLVDLARILRRVTTDRAASRRSEDLIFLTPDESAIVTGFIGRLLDATEAKSDEIAGRALAAFSAGFKEAKDNNMAVDLPLLDKGQKDNLNEYIRRAWDEERKLIGPQLLREAGWDTLSEDDKELIINVIRRARQRRSGSFALDVEISR
jgi:hypothetical protein